MSVMRFSLALMIILVFASPVFVFLAFADANEYEAVSALADAEKSVAFAYQTVLKAEEAGANVSALLVRLNEAGEHLARAQMEYELGNFEKAIDFANSSRIIGEEVQNAAVGLKDSALSDSLNRTLFAIIASVVGFAFVALGSLWVWHFLKKR